MLSSQTLSLLKLVHLLVDAVESIQEEGFFCHLDIKPDNIVLDRSWNALLIHLGYACVVQRRPVVEKRTGGRSRYLRREDHI